MSIVIELHSHLLSPSYHCAECGTFGRMALSNPSSTGMVLLLIKLLKVVKTFKPNTKLVFRRSLVNCVRQHQYTLK